jgi:hypothetical protein
MKRQDMLSVLITFVVGFVAGGYLYVSHFSKILNPDSVETAQSASEFTIIGEAYGSCGAQCPSFQTVKDGSYRYQFVAVAGQEKNIKSGTLPLEVQRAVKKALVEEDLVEQSQPVTPTDCNSRNDAIDIRYKISLEGAEYTLDSCGTAVDGEGELWNGLAKIWNYFQTVQ